MAQSARKLPDDPNLSERANELVAEELQEATGQPVERTPATRTAETSPASPFFATLAQSRVWVAIALAAALVFGVILSLATGSWWWFAVAIAAHAIGTLVVTGVVVQTLGMVERPRPETVAALEDEGVPNPERLINDRLEALEDEPQERPRTGRILGPGDVDRATESDADGRTAALEQQAAWTPAGRPTQAVEGFAGPISVMPYAIAVALLAIALIVPIAAGGGALWVVPLVVWPAVLLFALLDRAYRRAGR